ncbi:hypothetical protein [Marinicellulosiphila megalodicopiae]|uniref:hypothetical protein n=1 Tax=Marinicellulosiphila megalodicopiae TaxID=2724896 RepID=UPI003BAFB302
MNIQRFHTPLKWMLFINVGLYFLYFLYRVLGLAFLNNETFLGMITSNSGGVIIICWMFSIILAVGMFSIMYEKPLFSLYFWRASFYLCLLFCVGYVYAIVSSFSYFMLLQGEGVLELLFHLFVTINFCLIVFLMWYFLFKTKNNLVSICHSQSRFISHILSLIVLYLLFSTVVVKFTFLIPNEFGFLIVSALVLLYVHSLSVYLVYQRLLFLRMNKLFALLSVIPVINIPMVLFLMVKSDDLKLGVQNKAQLLITLFVLILIMGIEVYFRLTQGELSEMEHAIYYIFEEGMALYSL